MKVLRVEEVTRMVGIRRVLELLSGKRLPLVGFEMLNDLMFSYHWCVDRLPETCRNFVTNVARDFPLIIDVQVGVRRACDLRACVARRAWAPSCPTARRWRPSTRAWRRRGGLKRRRAVPRGWRCRRWRPSTCRRTTRVSAGSWGKAQASTRT